MDEGVDQADKEANVEKVKSWAGAYKVRSPPPVVVLVAQLNVGAHDSYFSYKDQVQDPSQADKQEHQRAPLLLGEDRLNNWRSLSVLVG